MTAGVDGYRRPIDVDGVAHNFRVFAAADCANEPLYAALSTAVAADDDTLALLMRAPYPQRRPVLLFAAVHNLLLAGDAHPLAGFYRSVAGDAARVDVDQAAVAFFDFCRTRRDALAATLAERATQTNEIGRSAGLRLALAMLDSDRPIALVDVGASAGLNLLVDRFRHVVTMPDGASRVAGPADGVVVPTTLVAGAPPADASPTIVRRIGIDRAPLDPRDASDARWLRACVWPSDDARHARLFAALALAHAHPPDLRRGDADACLDEVLRDIDPAARPVVFHSWVVSYFDHAARTRFVDRVRAMVVERDGAWISAEGPNVVPGLAPPPLPADADATRREATLWHLTTRANGAACSRTLARSHPHCRWIEWLA